MSYRALGALAAIAAAVAVSPASAAGPEKASLKVMRTLPLTIRGTAFRAGESVRVTVVMGVRRYTQETHAGTAGGFTVRWEGVRLNWCSMPLTISARAARTGKVAMKIPVAQCPPP